MDFRGARPASGGGSSGSLPPLPPPDAAGAYLVSFAFSSAELGVLEPTVSLLDPSDPDPDPDPGSEAEAA